MISEHESKTRFGRDGALLGPELRGDYSCMKSNKVVFLALVVVSGVALAGVFALERDHHGKRKAIRLGGKNNVKNISFVLPPDETTSNSNAVPAIITAPTKQVM